MAAKAAGCPGTAAVTESRVFTGANETAGTVTTVGEVLSEAGPPGLNLGLTPITAGEGGLGGNALSADPGCGNPATVTACTVSVTGTTGITSASGVASAAVVSTCANTIRGAVQITAIVTIAAVEVIIVSHVFARRGEALRCVFSIISILSFS